MDSEHYYANPLPPRGWTDTCHRRRGVVPVPASGGQKKNGGMDGVVSYFLSAVVCVPLRLGGAMVCVVMVSICGAVWRFFMLPSLRLLPLLLRSLCDENGFG